MLSIAKDLITAYKILHFVQGDKKGYLYVILKQP